MDGVLCDWENGYKKLSGGKNFEEVEASIGKNEAEKIFQSADSDFWSNLKWEKGGKELFDFCKKNFSKIKILSTSGAKEDKILHKKVKDGKLKWLKKNAPSISPSDIVIVTNRRLKKKYAKSNSILIDDNDNNIKDWENSGGIGILHDSDQHQKTMKKLNKMELTEIIGETIRSYFKSIGINEEIPQEEDGTMMAVNVSTPTWEETEEVKEGYGAGIPEKDRLHIKGKRWQIKSKDAPKTPQMNESTPYLKYGHNIGDYYWAYNNNDHEFKSFRQEKLGKEEGHPNEKMFSFWRQSNFCGRFDVNKNIITLTSSGLRGDLYHIPEDLIRRLKFEYGDNAKIKLCEVTQKDLKSNLPKQQYDYNTPLKNFSLDNLNAMKKKLERFYSYYKKKGKLTKFEEDYLSRIIKHHNEINNEINKRLEYINDPVLSESFLYYTDVGHKPGGYMWAYNKHGGEFKRHKVKDGEDSHKRVYWGFTRDFEGRYDPKYGIVSIVNMSEYEPDDGLTDSTRHLDGIPEDLIKRLKFEFGDKSVLRKYYQ